jgi:peptidoglycan glycosyltransferase/penicillin-binding protein 2
MAQSCNCYFAWLGQQLGYEAILDMAKKLGFGSVVMETTRFEEEAHGNLPRSEETGKWDVANLSIGQGALLVTPMQIQKMMSIVASGGIEVPLSVVKADVSQAGSTLGRRLLSTSSAALLEALLLGVMTEGTGSSETFSCPVFGKTGTAEGVSGGEEVSNCWFSGYCQVEGRKYVVTVLVEQGKTGSTSALPVFQEICDYLVTRNFTM